jgi:hypothetical protein
MPSGRPVRAAAPSGAPGIAPRPGADLRIRRVKGGTSARHRPVPAVVDRVLGHAAAALVRPRVPALHGPDDSLGDPMFSTTNFWIFGVLAGLISVLVLALWVIDKRR